MNEPATTAVVRPLNVEQPLLLPPRDPPYRLQDVCELVEDGCRVEIVLDFGDSYLLFQVDEDTDTFRAEFRDGGFPARPAYHSVRSAPPWGELLGKECWWTWVAVNQEGFCDTVLMSFDSIIPSVLLYVIASSLDVYTVAPTV